MNIPSDLSLDLYLHSLKLHRGHIAFLVYFQTGMAHMLPKHKFATDLMKSGYVYDDTITTKGIDLMNEVTNWEGIYEPKQKVKKAKIEYTPEFEKWWSTYPSTDNFEYAGQEFVGTRSLRSDQEKCSVMFQEALQHHSFESLLAALEYEVEARKDQSVIRKKNELSFFRGSHTYLNKRTYEDYIPLIKKGKYISKSKEDNKVVINKIAF